MDSRTVLITGGSGAVGSALVRRFVADGYRVAFTFLNHRASAEALAGETGALALPADLTRRPQVQAMVEKLLGHFGTLDVLVNNAGRTQVMPFALIEDEDWDAIMAANLKTMYLVTQETIRGMIQRKQGVIVNIGSLAGHRLLDVPVHYAAAKAGVTGFTLALAKELSRYKIRVNEVVPGLLSQGVGTLVPAQEMAEYTKYCTAGRPGTPEEVADVVAFLASERATYVNAQSIHVNGGV
jgi:3-oxoacyl-[acyl-carrier protein] reductase